MDAHQIRITSHGKIRAWVEFALNHLSVCSSIFMRIMYGPIFLQNNPETPLSLHTLPTDPLKGRGSTMTIPRLISVVEIIKREYLAALDINRSTSLRGLHQYNEIGCFDQEKSTTDDDRTQALAVALEGKNQ